jgi:serine phosphatase RsbU (regulator of sigma subunit)/CheY-like chemotaxis protein
MATLQRVGPLDFRDDRGPESELVLYVEDDADNWRVTRARLRRRFRLVWARTAREACELVRTHGEQIFAILMDIELKGSDLDGIQLTRLIRGTFAREQAPSYARDVPVLDRVPIFFVTAYGPQYPEDELIAAGGDRRLTKPVDFAELSLSLSLLDVEQLSMLALDIVKQAGTPGATPENLWARAARDPLFSQRMRALIETDLFGADHPETIQHLRNLALAIVLVSLVREHSSASELVAACVRRAVAAASIARRKLPAQVSDCFAMGMLLDAGLITRARHDLAGVVELTNSPAGERLVRERAAGEPEHPILGAKLAESWGLSKSIQEAVRYHHNPYDFESLLGFGWAAEVAAAFFEGGDVIRNRVEAMRALDRVGLTQEEAVELLREIPDRVARAAVAMGCPVKQQASLEVMLDPSAVIDELGRSYRDAVHALGVVGTEKQELVRSQREVNHELVSARDRERSVRAAVQAFFLPQRISGRFPGFDLFAAHRSADECGGDWWWCDPNLEDPSVFIGDATGRGVEAAMVTASIASAFRVFRKVMRGSGVEGMMRALHEHLWETTGGQRAMTMSAVRLDPAARKLDWWTAAAPRILISRSDGKLEEIVARGTPLGSTAKVVLGHVEVAIAPNDRVLLFTDGAPDARTRSDNKIGARRFAEMFAATRTLEGPEVLRSLVRSVDDARGGTPQDDDMTLVLLEILSA